MRGFSVGVPGHTRSDEKSACHAGPASGVEERWSVFSEKERELVNRRPFRDITISRTFFSAIPMKGPSKQITHEIANT